MNSSANQISPIGLRKRNRFRAWPISSDPTGFPDALEIPSRTGRLRAGICRQRRGLRKAESWAWAGAGTDAGSPLVALRKGIIDALPEFWRVRLTGHPAAVPLRKAAINGVLTHF
jgi:hypothetical protein